MFSDVTSLSGYVQQHFRLDAATLVERHAPAVASLQIPHSLIKDLVHLPDNNVVAIRPNNLHICVFGVVEDLAFRILRPLAGSCEQRVSNIDYSWAARGNIPGMSASIRDLWKSTTNMMM